MLGLPIIMPADYNRYYRIPSYIYIYVYISVTSKNVYILVASNIFVSVMLTVISVQTLVH